MGAHKQLGHQEKEPEAYGLDEASITGKGGRDVG
jgi:hypothetical protein